MGFNSGFKGLSDLLCVGRWVFDYREDDAFLLFCRQLSTLLGYAHRLVD